jgi:hypothetical protein
MSTAQLDGTTVRVGESNVTLSLVPVVTGRPLTVDAKVTSADNTLIDYALLCVHEQPNQPCTSGEIKGFDGTDRMSGSTYSFKKVELGFPVAKGTLFLRVEALDLSTIKRKGAAELAILVAE